jgi:hypothetical protein
VRPPLPTSLGPRSTGSAVIIRARLPAGLERLRRRSIGDAADGVPAHLTLLYPFVAPERLDGSVRRTILDVAATIDPFDYDLIGGARWPDTVYAAVDPVEPFVELQAALQAAFPAFPIYGEPPGPSSCLTCPSPKERQPPVRRRSPTPAGDDCLARPERSRSSSSPGRTAAAGEPSGGSASEGPVARPAARMPP